MPTVLWKSGHLITKSERHPQIDIICLTQRAKAWKTVFRRQIERGKRGSPVLIEDLFRGWGERCYSLIAISFSLFRCRR